MAALTHKQMTTAVVCEGITSLLAFAGTGSIDHDTIKDTVRQWTASNPECLELAGAIIKYLDAAEDDE